MVGRQHALANKYINTILPDHVRNFDEQRVVSAIIIVI